MKEAEIGGLMREALHLPISAIAYEVSRRLAALYPDRALLDAALAQADH